MNYCSFDKFEFAVYDAVANFSDGRQGSIDVLQKMNICPGYHTANEHLSWISHNKTFVLDITQQMNICPGYHTTNEHLSPGYHTTNEHLSWISHNK